MGILYISTKRNTP